MKPVLIMDVPIHPVANKNMLQLLHQMVTDGRVHTIMTPNPEMVMTANRDEGLMRALTSADLVIPDGIGLIIAAKLNGIPLRERVTGIDTMEKILRLCHEKHLSLFILGGKPGRADTAIDNICAKYPGIRSAASHHGYFSVEENDEVIQLINKNSPDVLFVCLGSPRQEIWIHENKESIDVKVAMGAGGSVDVHAGVVKRAPVFFQKVGLEWLYRLFQEPSRIGRMLVLPVFLWKSLFIKKKAN